VFYGMQENCDEIDALYESGVIFYVYKISHWTKNMSMVLTLLSFKQE
jgi:hypothetical protein